MSDDETDALLRRAAEAPLAGAMAMTLGHELAQPLSALSMRLDDAIRLLRSGPDNAPDALARLEKAADDAAFAAAIVSRVRGLASARTWQFGPVALGEVAERALSLLESEARRGGVTVKRALPGGLPPALGDAVMLQQVLVNLCRNAIEASAGARTRVVTVTAAPFREGGRAGREMMLLTVADTGPGLGEEASRRAGEAFYTTKPHGTGLGLATCRSIAALHKGRLWFAPGEGGGTVFHLSVPRA